MIHHVGRYRRYIEPIDPIISQTEKEFAGMSPQVQIIFSDGGPWCEHNVACPVCGDRGAIMDLGRGVFMPCDMCTKNGWGLKRKTRWWRRRA